ncbi:MAG: nicotinamide-nucleotide amidohydrolase family protein [Candidatus Rokubacteria bacterium]|nr:nicotinamide-nucleotide amidohydrolase family protein [Candidatus Rokubacteria bacterium]
MIGARVITVGAAQLASSEDAAGLAVARAIQAEGLPVTGREVVDEDEGALEAALRLGLETPGVVVVLAPPGGSSGEIVRRVVARLAEVRLVLSERLLAVLEADFSLRGQAMPRRLDRLALLPQGAHVWPGPAGEPAWALEIGKTLVAVLPADAAHLPALTEEQLRPALRQRLGAGEAAILRTLRTAGLAAAEAEARLGPWLGKEGPVSVSCVLAEGEMWVRLLARGASRGLAAAALQAVEDEVARALGVDCYGRDGESLEQALGSLLVARGLTLSVAESCTGGLLASRLTDVPGSSRYFDRGVIVYSNEAKEELLGVPRALLRAHGAVSAPVAEAMVRGICTASKSPCGLAVTGIAGPDGGTPEKPVGTVFIAVASPAAVEVSRFRFAGSRGAVKWRSSQAALDGLRRLLLR